MYCFFKYKPNTCQYQQIPAQYKYNTLMTRSKPVVVKGRVLACICMFLACFLYVFACICLYWRPLTTTGSLPCCIACMACIGMYEYIFCMYWYVFCLYIQALYKRIRTYKQIQTKYKSRIYECIVYVECMYFMYLCVLIMNMKIVSWNRLSRRICKCELILIVSAVITATACVYFPHITQTIRDDLMARPWPMCWCRRVCSHILAH